MTGHPNRNESSPAEQVVAAISRIYARGLTTTSGGNVSVLDSDLSLWITPSMVDKGRLSADDIMCVAKTGQVSGPHRPSSEYPFHRAIYEARPDLGAIIHAHPPSLVSFSLVHSIPDTGVMNRAFELCGPAGYARYETPGSNELGERLAAEFSAGHNAVIMENHGIVTAGKDIYEAYLRFGMIELCASAIISGRSLGTEKHPLVSRHDQDELPSLTGFDRPAQMMHDEAFGMKDNDLCLFVRRAADHGLLVNDAATVSVRLDDDDFLVTPLHSDSWDLSPGDIVRVTGGGYDKLRKPGKDAAMHREIYLRHPGISSVITTHPPHLMAFAVTHTEINVRTIPESWIFLQDIPLLHRGTHGNMLKGIHEALERKIPAVIIGNDSVMVTGETLLQAFDRLEVAEFSARSVILARSLGELIPITDEQVAELRRIYLGG